ncbi:hypothetical protein EJB05_38743, partial [Eragrostis curvula]
MEARLLSDEQLPQSDGEKQQRMSMPDAVVWLIGAAVVAFVVATLIFLVAYGIAGLHSSERRAEYSVTIHGFAGVEDSVRREFNLTVGIDNLGGTFEVCVGGEAVVLYGGVPLAVGQVQDLCVPRQRAADMAVVAASGGVGVPGALAGLMAGEKRADGAVHVEVRVISAKHGRLLSCTAPLGQGPPRPYPCSVAYFTDESDGVRPQGSGTPGFIV